MPYADDAGVVSQSPEQLKKITGVIVVVCAASGLTLSEVKTEIICLRPKGMSQSTAIFSVEAAGQVLLLLLLLFLTFSVLVAIPKKITSHGGQPRLWSAKQGKIEKKKSLAAHNQTNEFEYLGRNVNHNADLSIEVNRRTHNAWYSFRKYTLKLYDRPSTPSSSKFGC